MGRVCLLDGGKICTKCLEECLEEEACEGMGKNECENCPRWLNIPHQGREAKQTKN